LPLGSVASMIVVTVAHRSIKIVNRRLRLCIVGFVTLLSSDKNNQLLSGSQPAPREGESLASQEYRRKKTVSSCIYSRNMRHTFETSRTHAVEQRLKFPFHFVELLFN